MAYVYKGSIGVVVPGYPPVAEPEPPTCQPQYGLRDFLKDLSLGLGIVFTALSIKNLSKRK